MKRLSKIALNIATAVLVSTSIVVPAQQAQAVPTESVGPCTPVHIVTVNGTGASADEASSNIGLDLQSRFARELTKKHIGQVSSYLVPYPAAAGAISSINPVTTSATTYGESRLRGDAKSLEHIEAYAEQCPNSAFLMYGYSQGASVAGDVTALLANGALENVSKDKILGAVLIADPGNSGASKHSGPSNPSKYYIPHPPNSVYNKNGEMIHTRNNNKTVGWTGQRSLGFDGIEGRVISLCADGDLACSAAPGGSVQREVADLSDKNIQPNWGYTYGIPLLHVVLRKPKETIGLLKEDGKSFFSLFSKSIQEVIDNGREKIEKSDFNELEKATLINVSDELEQLNEILHSDKMYGNDVSDFKIVVHALSQSGDLVKAFLPPQLKQYEPQIENVILAAKGMSLTIPPEKLIKVTPIMNNFVTFPERHGYYFNQNKMDVEGKNANDWSIEAASEGIDRYLRNDAMTLSGDFSNSGEKELAENNRLPDGLEDMLQNGYQKYLITRDTIPDEVVRTIAKSGGDPNKIDIPEESSGESNISNDNKTSETNNDKQKREQVNSEEKKDGKEQDSINKYFEEDYSKDIPERDFDSDIYNDEKQSSQSEDEEMRDALLWLKEMQYEKELEEKEKEVEEDNSDTVEFASPQSDASRSIGSSKPTYIKSTSTLAPSANKDEKDDVDDTDTSEKPSSSLTSEEKEDTKKEENVKPVVGPSVDTGGKIDTSIFGRLRNIFK